MCTQEEIASLITAIHRDMDVGHTQRVNQRLSEALASVNETEPEVLLAYLRTTYMIRKELPAWHHLLDASVREMQRRGLNAEKLCWGIKKDD